MSFDNVGKSWNNPQAFANWLSKQKSGDRTIHRIVMHHTASPSLDQRPVGLTDQHIKNMQHFYEVEKGWSAGPHFFVDDHRVMGMTPIQDQGIHANSLNTGSIGIEVLGNYDLEDPYSGRGAVCWDNAAWCVKEILNRFPGCKILGHRDAPESNKTCPGAKVDLDKFRYEVSHEQQPDPAEKQLKSALLDRLNDIRYQLDKIEKYYC